MLAVLAAAILIVVASVCWLLFGFWLQFVGLSIAYGIVACGIVYVTEKYYISKTAKLKKSERVNQWDYFKDNNTWWFVLVGCTALTFVIALFHFGAAVLLPEHLPTPEQRGGISYFFDHLWSGKNAPPRSVPTEPLPWATGTWFWWKAFGVYLLLTIGYFPIAFWDEFSHAWNETGKFIHERWDEHKRREEEEAEERRLHPQQPGANQPPRSNGGRHFADILKAEFIVEIASEFFKYFMEKRRA